MNKMKFKPVQSTRLYKEVVQQIQNAILREEIKPGDRLPPENEMAKQFGVSKASIREAFRGLESLGLLEIRQGSTGGAFVREVDWNIAQDNLLFYIFFQNPSISEFSEFRLILEPPLVEIATYRITDSDLYKLENNLDETKRTMEREDNLDNNYDIYELDIQFHQEIAAISNNHLVTFIIGSMQNALVNIKKLLQPDISFSRQVYDAHLNIFKALKDKDAQKAKSEMTKHIHEVEKGLMELSQKKTDTPFSHDSNVF